jgi:O-antigen/teichoic acid export membrane protein
MSLSKVCAVSRRCSIRLVFRIFSFAFALSVLSGAEAFMNSGFSIVSTHFLARSRVGTSCSRTAELRIKAPRPALNRIACTAKPVASTSGVGSLENSKPEGKLPKSRGEVLRDVASIAAPVLGACLVEPALTMIDTWFVGRLRPPPVRAAVLGLAALSANCSLFNLLTTALSFFCTATAGLVARGAAAGDLSAARRALSHGAFLSAVAGSVLGAGLLLFAGPILTVRGDRSGQPGMGPMAGRLLSLRMQCAEHAL